MAGLGAPVLVVGDLIVDVRIETDEAPARGEEVEGRITLGGGGSAANQAAWLAGLGVDVRFVGRVGCDAAGAALCDELEAHGVEVHAERDREHPTGTVAALIHEDGERSLVTSRGANARLQMSDVPDERWEEVGLLVVTGYLFTRPSICSAGRLLLAEAKRRGVPFALDPASARLVMSFPGTRDFLEWTRGAEWCFPNSSEARALGKANDDESAARSLLHFYEGVAVTGRGGCTVATSSTVHFEPAAGQARVVDAFAAGFLAAGLRLGSLPASRSDLPALARAGLELAAQALSTPGALPPPPPRPDSSF